MERTIANLSLRDEKDDTLQLGVEAVETDLTYEKCFVGLFLTTSVINFQAMRSTLAKVWHPIGGVSISKLEEGRFLFHFYLEADVKSVERDGPWSFNSHLLIMHRLLEGESPTWIELNWVDFWVLIHDLPHGFSLKWWLSNWGISLEFLLSMMLPLD